MDRVLGFSGYLQKAKSRGAKELKGNGIKR
jgi:hypothetical protein